MTEVLLRLVVFRNPMGIFVAQCLEHDLTASGDTPEATLGRLSKLIGDNREEAGKRDVPAFSNVGKAPPYYWELAGVVRGED